MQIYPTHPSFVSDQSFGLGVEPGVTFGIAVYRQDEDEYLTPLGRCELFATEGNVSYKGAKTFYPWFQSSGSLGPRSYEQNWGWPTVSLKLPLDARSTSGVYAAVAFPVDAQGEPTDALGAEVKSRTPISAVTRAASMALLVGRPASPTPAAKIAYIVPIATYHAYNGTGGGCFYGYPWLGIQQVDRVTTLRPGGGLGARLGEPPDPYDEGSPRQQFPHWDAKFVRWLKTQQGASLLPAADYYTDIDLHMGITGLSQYKVVVSAGHHEYWSGAMKSELERFLQGNGNYACFSGNTCFRPIDFGAYRNPEFMTSVRKLGANWPDYEESRLVGLSYHWGGGKWGEYSTVQGKWINTGRPNYGLALRPGMASHWAFVRSGLQEGGTVGGPNDHLVGYEADGVAPGDASVKILAQSPVLTGFQDNFQGNGKGAMILKNDPGANPARGAIFNVGTTDWARVLMDASAAANTAVAVITFRVLRKFTALELLDSGPAGA
jgi:hypothetical protein